MFTSHHFFYKPIRFVIFLGHMTEVSQLIKKIVTGSNKIRKIMKLGFPSAYSVVNISTKN